VFIEMAKHKQKSTFAKNVVARRSKLGWTGEQLAEKAEISYSAVRDIEAGVSNGRESSKIAIAKALNCTVDDLNRDETTSPGIVELALAIAKLKEELEYYKNSLRVKISASQAREFSHLPQDLYEALQRVKPTEIDAIRAALGLGFKKKQKADRSSST
jgi:transcriptional regulator with XRE-family HTH domain